MAVIELPTIPEPKEDWERIEAEISRVFRKAIYLPLIKELIGQTLKNAKPGLNDAIVSGQIQFYRGTFSGRFNAGISKELRAIGAKWDRKTRTYKIPQSSLPPDIRMAISSSRSRFEQVLSRIDDKLSKILPEEIADKMRLSDLFDSTLWRVERSFKKSVGKLLVAPQLDDKARKSIADDWANNMKLDIKGWTDNEVRSLRQKMQKAVFAGNRYESAAKMIRRSYGVSQNKARFLARQETNLLLAKFQQTRYEAAGVKKYIWGCVTGTKAHPVRDSHRKLEGKTFSWDDPPITTPPGETVRRNNPKQDFNCRCFARPILEIKK